MGVNRGARRNKKQEPVRGQVELSSLGLDDLHRLLELAKSRGQAGLTEQLRAELEARNRGEGMARRPTASASRPRPALGRGPATAVVAISAMIGAGLAWGLSLPRLNMQAQDTTPRAMVVRTAAAPAATAVAQPASEGPAASTELPPQDAAAGETSAAKSNTCLDLPTPGERLICGYPSLAIQDRHLTEIYQRALQNSDDPVALANTQAAWRKARDAISDRQALVAFYDARIDELEAAASAPARPPS